MRPGRTACSQASDAGTQVTLGAFDPKRALDAIAQHGGTQTLVVPTMLAALAEEQLQRPRETRTLRAIAHGGSPVAIEVLRRGCQAFPNAELVEVYGATELSPLATALTGEDALLDHERGRSCGRAVVGVRVRVVDTSGRTQPCGDCEAAQSERVLVTGTSPGDCGACARRILDGRSGRMDDRVLYLVDRCKDIS
jgi:long-chain acyl-CoA synthetase